MIRRLIPALFLCMLLLPAAALAAETAPPAKIRYHQDPAYQMLGSGDSHPMDDLRALAEEGDARAQFILGDLYAKGKGGLRKNTVKAHYWFENSAKEGNADSFIRLAALAKHRKDPVAAYKWYTLALEDLPHGQARRWAADARAALVKDAALDKKATAAAQTAANAWKKNLREEKRKRSEERRRAASEAPPVKAAPKQKKPAPEKSAAPTPPAKKETAYND